MKVKLSSWLINAISAFVFIIAGMGIAAGAPANDNWESAQPLAYQYLTAGNNTDATIQACEPNHTFAEQTYITAKYSVWYKFQVPATASYTIRTFDTDFPLVISAYRIMPGFCNGGTANIPYRINEGNTYNGNVGAQEYARISFRANQGETIYVSVDSVSSLSRGAFLLFTEKTKFQYGAQLDWTNGAADLVVNDSAGQWWVSRHAALLPDPTSVSAFTFGQFPDIGFVADFDGDAVSDFAVSRRENGKLTWWVTQRLGYLIKVVQFGLESDRPIVGDWDGDGMADIGVTRDDGAGRKVWHILRSSDGQYQAIQYGLDQDKEMVGDYDGDGKTDLVVLRPGVYPVETLTWYIRLSSTGADISREFGHRLDFPQVADFDGDGRTDITLFRSDTGTWYSLDSNSPVPLPERPARVVQFGIPGDRPQAADYDGDRKTDYAVYRSGYWWIRYSRNGLIKTYKFGANYHAPMTDGGIYNAHGL